MSKVHRNLIKCGFFRHLGNCPDYANRLIVRWLNAYFRCLLVGEKEPHESLLKCTIKYTCDGKQRKGQAHHYAEKIRGFATEKCKI